MNRYFFTLLFVLFSSFLLSQSTFYVAPSSSGGSDSNNGSIGSPFETIQYGVNQLSSVVINSISEQVHTGRQLL